MKLFLSSIAISKKQAPHFIRLVGKAPQNIRLALIENAADVEKGSKIWVTENRRGMQTLGFDVEVVDLTHYRGSRQNLKKKLASKDAIWLGGGNTYYLRWLLRETGADAIITELVGKGTVYGGGSAGAIVAGPTLKYFETADDPSESPKVMLVGLKLTDTVVVPHMDNAKFAAVIHDINDKLKAAGYKTVPLGDSQALIIEGGRQRVI